MADLARLSHSCRSFFNLKDVSADSQIYINRNDIPFEFSLKLFSLCSIGNVPRVGFFS